METVTGYDGRHWSVGDRVRVRTSCRQGELVSIANEGVGNVKWPQEENTTTEYLQHLELILE